MKSTVCVSYIHDMLMPALMQQFIHRNNVIILMRHADSYVMLALIVQYTICYDVTILYRGFQYSCH